MIFFVFRLVITTAVTLFAAHILPGLAVKNDLDALLFGLTLGLINAVVRPVLVILTLPITLFTLGLFLFVINAFTFWIASEVSYGVHISTLSGAFLGGALVCISGLFTNRIVWDQHIC